MRPTLCALWVLSKGVRAVCAMLLLAASFVAQATSDGSSPLLILTYHDVVADGHALTEVDAVSVTRLAHHLGWLAAAGYTPVTLARLDAVRAGREHLPERAVLLMFDDGYASFYERVLPLLRAYRFPAVVALVSSWLDSNTPHHSDASGTPGGARIRAPLMTTAQIREVAQSGLVEFASHTDDLHRGIAIDARGAELPAASAAAYDATTGSYETAAQFEARIRADLWVSREKLEALTGSEVFALVWPYGQSNASAERIAAQEGFRFTFSLRGGLADLARGTASLPRKYVTRDPSLADLSWYATSPTRPMQRAQFVQLADTELADHDFMLAREQAVAAIHAQSVTQAILTSTTLRALAQCDAAALVPPSAAVQAQSTHLAWHLARRAGALPFVALPDPACTPALQWQRLVERLVEQRPLEGVFIVEDATRVATEARGAAMHWLTTRYPQLTVFASGAAHEPAHPVRVFDACTTAPVEPGVLALVQAKEGCEPERALRQLAARGWRWLGRAEPLVLDATHPAPATRTAQVHE